MRRVHRLWPHTIPIARAGLIAALIALLPGCLGEPAERTCADFDRDTPECADYWAARSDGGVEPDAQVAPDAGPEDAERDPDHDVDPDLAVDPDLGADPDVGQIDADLTECVPGTERACGSDEGACVAGREFCTPEGVYSGECLEAIGPTEEVCDGIDNDCDGTIDAGCDCADGEIRPCGSDVGVCEPGQQSCVDGRWSEDCIDSVTPVPEACTGADDDCNGVVDDHPDVGQPCSAGVGACASDGILACDGIAPLPVCNAEVGRPVGEVCNTIDDDCDGRTDEEMPAMPTDRALTAAQNGRVAIAASGEFHGALYIDPDSAVWFALLAGDDFEIQPFMMDDYPGRAADIYAEALDLEPISPAGDFAYAVSIGDVGGVYTHVGRLSSAGEVVNRRVIDGYGDRLSVAWDGQEAAVAWEEAINNNTTTIGFSSGRVEQIFENFGQLDAVQPSLAWSGESFGLVSVHLDQRAEDGEIWFRTVSRNGEAGRPLRVGAGLGRNPDLRWVARLERYVLAWSALIDGEHRIVMALLRPDGQLDGRVYTLGGTDARWPSVAAIEDWRRQDPVTQIAVVYQENAGRFPTLFVRWLLLSDQGWAPSAASAQLDSAQISSTRPVMGYAGEGADLAVLTVSTQAGAGGVATSFSGYLGCPSGPGMLRGPQ